MTKLAFHYCSIDTFFAIISNQTLRLSDVVKSNDNLEVLWMKKVLSDMLENEKMFYNQFNEKIKNIITYDTYTIKIKEKMESFFDKKELKSRFFVLCFSGEKSEDRLSQWRGYGADGSGVAIGFDQSILNKTSRKFVMNNDSGKIEFRNIEYNLELQKEKVRTFWNEQVHLANDKVKTVEVDFEIWLLDTFSKLYEEAIFMKNPFFEEEDESRIVFEKNDEICLFIGECLQNKIILNEGNIFIRNGRIVEYYDLDISKLKKGFIKKVILGPKCTTEKEDIQMLLKKYGFEDVDVVWSKGSYR